MPCGPNLLKDDDPVFSQRADDYHVGPSTTSTSSPSESAESLTTSHEYPSYRSGNATPAGDGVGEISTSCGEQKEIEGDLATYSDERLKVEALAKYNFPRTLYDLTLIVLTHRLNELNALVEHLVHQSHASAIACEHLPSEGPYASSFTAMIHSLFTDTYLIALESRKREQEDRALRILFPLIGALNRNPSLYDSLKPDALTEIAGIFQQYGHDWESEQLLRRASSMQVEQPAATTDLSSTLLANSLSKTSETMRLVVAKGCQSDFGCESVPAEPTVTTFHRAAKERNVNVVAAVWSQAGWDYLSKFVSHQPDMFPSADLNGQVDQRLDVEARDFRCRTALFLAADSGLYQVCYFLLQTALADPNARDSCGHTMLEIAAKGGHLEAVQYLVAAGAVINPVMTLCASSPLQAAVESPHSHAGLVEFLLGKGADPHVRRPSDSKNAIEIAKTKGLHELAQRMRSIKIKK